MQILSGSQFQYINNKNKFVSCFVTRVFNLIICDYVVKFLSTFKHLCQMDER